MGWGGWVDVDGVWDVVEGERGGERDERKGIVWMLLGTSGWMGQRAWLFWNEETRRMGGLSEKGTK